MMMMSNQDRNHPKASSTSERQAKLAMLFGGLALLVSLFSLVLSVKEEAFAKRMLGQSFSAATEGGIRPSQALPLQGKGIFGMPESLVADVASSVAPSVVNIDTETEQRIQRTPFDGLFGGGLFGSFFGEQGGMFNDVPQEETRKVLGNGSGMILDTQGHILTNDHVIRQADKMVVTLNNGKQLPAKLIGRDPLTDLAVIQVKGDALKALPFGTSKTLRPGQWVLAIGSPLGFDHTVTLGIISGISRRIPDLSSDVDYIQTDAAINPGNSGGPLVDLQGQIIGINTAISGKAQNIGFAIPADTAKEVAQALITQGRVIRPYVGVSTAALNADILKSLNLPLDTKGVVVAKVIEGSPASQAGLQVGDVIQRVNETPVVEPEILRKTVRTAGIGKPIRLLVLREGKLTGMTLTTKEYPQSGS
jgi:serine protease Do